LRGRGVVRFRAGLSLRDRPALRRDPLRRLVPVAAIVDAPETALFRGWASGVPFTAIEVLGRRARYEQQLRDDRRGDRLRLLAVDARQPIGQVMRAIDELRCRVPRSGG
jgi:hypothetical protein